MGFLKSLGNVVKAGLTASLDIPTLGAYSGSWTGQKQQDDANKMAMQAWNLANDYNHPLQQMARLKEAGLNPLLVYGSGSVTGNTTSAPALTGGGISTSTEGMFKGLGNIVGAAQGFANLRNTNAQTTAAGASAALSGAQMSKVQAETSIIPERWDLEQRSMIADIDYKEALADKTRAEATMSQGEAELLGGAGGSKGVGTGIKIMRGLRSIFK